MTAVDEGRRVDLEVRTALEAIRRAWPHLIDPPATGDRGGRRVPGSRIPTHADALSLRADITATLTRWCHLLGRDHPEGRTNRDTPLRLGHVPSMLDHLRDEALWISGWTFADDVVRDLSRLARQAAALAWPPTRDTFPIGECPNTIGVDGEAVVCGATIRVNPRRPGDVKCPRCGLSDTLDGWVLRQVGDGEAVTATQLVAILHRRLGVVVKPSVVRKWKERGLVRAVGRDDHGRDLFDVHEALVVVTHRGVAS